MPDVESSSLSSPDCSDGAYVRVAVGKLVEGVVGLEVTTEDGVMVGATVGTAEAFVGAKDGFDVGATA